MWLLYHVIKTFSLQCFASSSSALDHEQANVLVERVMYSSPGNYTEKFASLGSLAVTIPFDIVMYLQIDVRLFKKTFLKCRYLQYSKIL